MANHKIEGMAGMIGVALPFGWNLSGGDEVVVSEAEYQIIINDPEIFSRVLDNGETADNVTAVPTWRDIQWRVAEGNTPGPPGASAYQIAVANGFVGSITAWLASLQGEDGEDGEDGQDGEDGAPGLSAYQVAVLNGFVGSQPDWVLSLRGPEGDPGRSAYQIAVDNGFVGNQAAWLASLKGDKGDDGEDGTDGIDAVGLPQFYVGGSEPPPLPDYPVLWLDEQSPGHYKAMLVPAS